MKKSIVPILVVLAIIAAIGIRLASNKKKLDETKKAPVEVDIAVPVATYKVQYQNIDNNLVKSGRLIPFKEANIMSTGNGKLTSLRFDLGTFVSQGAVIATIDSRLLELNLEQARLNKEKAGKDLKRFEKLLEGEATTEATFQDIKLNYENSSIQIETIQKHLADNRIKAPISGQIVRKDIELGEVVGAGSPLGKIVDISRLKARVMVSEQDVYSLKLGTKVNITTDVYPEDVFEGSVTFISVDGDPAHNYEVEITLNNPKSTPLKAGTFVYVDFQRASLENLLLVPRSALVESLQNPYVYIVKNEKAVRKDIIIAKDLGNYVEVSSGLDEGDIVITSGQINITEGSKVNAIETN